MSSTTSSAVVSIVPYIDGNGIHIPEFADVLTAFQQQYYNIYGADSYITSDSQDGQLIGVQAKAYYDALTFCVAVFNAYGPNSAVGVGLSTVVLQNGISRGAPVNSQVPLLISGNPGVILNNAYATDTNNNQWNIPNGLTIPTSGLINTTGVCSVAGPVTAVANSVTKLGVNIFGWNGVTNPQAAIAGTSGETDAQLRIRQQISTQNAAITPLMSVAGNVAAITGVTRVLPYENDTPVVNSYGMPPHSISLVVDGGDPNLIAQAIANTKTLGTPTYGNTSITIYNAYNNPQVINFNRSVQVEIVGSLTITPGLGYTSNIDTQIKAAIVAYIMSTVPIGGLVSVSKLYVPANLSNSAVSNSYEVVLGSLLIGIKGGVAPTATDIQLAYNAEAYTTAADWTITP